MNISKNNVAAIRFNMQDQYNQENWEEEHASTSGHNQGMLPHHGHQGQHLYKVGGSKMKLGAATSTNFMKQGSQNQQYNMSMLRSVQQNMPNMPNEYNYKIPAAASQSKIISGGQSNSVGYRGNTRKFVMQNPHQMQMVAELNN